MKHNDFGFIDEIKKFVNDNKNNLIRVITSEQVEKSSMRISNEMESLEEEIGGISSFSQEDFFFKLVN